MPPKRGVARSGQTPSKKAKIVGTPEKGSSDEEVQASSSTPRKSSREWQPTPHQLEAIANKAPAKKKKTLATVEAQKAARAGRSPTKVSERKPPTDRSSSTPSSKSTPSSEKSSSSSSSSSSQKASKKSSPKKSRRSNNNNKDAEEKDEPEIEQEEKNVKKSSSKKSASSSSSSRSASKAAEDVQEGTKKPSSKRASRSSKSSEEEEQEGRNAKKPSSKSSRSSKSSDEKEGAEEPEEKAAENEEKKGAGKGRKAGGGRGKASGKKESEEKKDTSVQAPLKMEQLHPDIVPKLTAYRKSRAFDPEDWINKKCKIFNDYMTQCGLKACVVSLSGGVDSAVTLGLMSHASKMKGSTIEKVAAIAQPIKSSAWALNRARECAKKFDTEMYVVDQTELHSELQALVDKAVGIEGKNFATGQLRSYMRTPVGYYVAQLISQNGQPCVVMGTGNMDEDGYLAYFCKAGDGVVDIQLIADLHKSEVFAVGKALGVPESILVAPPSADLWEGHTDEEELGFTYDFVELFTGHFNGLSPADQKKFVASLSKPAKEQWGRWSEACIKVHNRNKHKIGGPKNLNVLDNH